MTVAGTLPIPKRAEDVDSWCERMQRERLNESGREAIGLAAMALRAMFADLEAVANDRKVLAGFIQTLDPEKQARAIENYTDKLMKLPRPSEVMARTLKVVEPQIRVALACDKGESDRSLVALREYAERQEALALDFGPQDTEPESPSESPADAPSIKGDKRDKGDKGDPA